ncbi:ABC transporter ATP-binding protein [Marvinbryantia formatexigens DSM 14469]|nr:ABC transporter ATP-binding protein [Marvinbryantia formatexigens]UWO27046.1 ABC transporter ATP-binding protein [Marvinbryantia formatexigens DSM 14469]
MANRKTAKDHVLKAEQLQVGYGKKVIVKDMNITIPDHKITVIIGSNGCGKSTLLKAFARLIPVMQGEILLDGKNYGSIQQKQLAQIIGLLPQSPLVPEGIRVFDLVARGRYPYQKAFRGMTKEDYEAVDEAMEMMGVAEYADRNVEELSGGQRQRVWIAMTLAQQTDILFLDEPTTYLDITYQVEILDLLTELNRTRKTTIVMVLHDINLSARYADYLFALRDGRLIAEGTPEDIVTEKLIWETFHLNCLVEKDPVSASPYILPKGRYHVR